ncbi:integrase arm-type DNA-binding domain-containing protein [Sphingomonas yunnanensis]|uniref:tyrosine-type recombinase/integrase n=1 Tax=Sphingomonas yunnanensis TaxID=310400 RepID=UPI001CA5F9ED|nr:integrase arm-type DNA-binding domain-containing protein [Sphingomonas yunnanensis]MBY9063230.1 integrase arm-type DNA-binding domain-containing protein [Sphingomonas yunnanensis]
MLTNAAVKAARPRAAAYKIADERGMHLFVAPTGRKSFRWRFRFAGHEQLLTIGQWPEISLDAARARAESAREQLGRGVDPRTIASAMTFERAARAWHEQQLAGWTPVHARDVLASLEADVFPDLGALELDAIDAPAVLRIVRSIERRGAIATARRVRQRISDVFALAVSEGWAPTDPAAVVGRALAPAPAVRRQPAVTTIAEARELLAAAELVDAGAAVKLASRFLALTAVRLAVVRGACWSEIEDLDGNEPLWRVPAARMTLAAAKKLIAANDHLVPLAPAAVEVLRAARALGAGGELIFAGRGGAAPIGEGAIGALYDRAGFARRHVPHGWRATFSTILNERLPDQRSAIDRALGHALKREDGSAAKVLSAYNRAQHLAPRRRLYEAWAEILMG